MTEPYTVDNKIVSMPRGTKSIFARKKGIGAPRAGIVASADVNLNAMDNWCNKDCVVALTKIRGI